MFRAIALMAILIATAALTIGLVSFPLGRRNFIFVRTEKSGERSITVKGHAGHLFCVTSIQLKKEGSAISVIPMAHLNDSVLFSSRSCNGAISFPILLSDDIQEIRLGKDNAVIWASASQR